MAKTTFWSAVFTLANTAIGVGCLAFPFTYRLGGVMGALLLSIVVVALMVFSLISLVTCAQYYHAESYQVLVERSLKGFIGKISSTALGIILFLYLFGSLVAYHIVVGDVFPPLVHIFVGKESIWCQRWLIITLPAVFISLPLSLARTLGELSVVSVFSLVALLYTAGSILVCSIVMIAQRDDGMRTDLNWGVLTDLQTLQALPMMVFAFQCQVTVIQIFTELEAVPGNANSKSEEGQAECLLVGDEERADGESGGEGGGSSLAAPLLPHHPPLVAEPSNLAGDKLATMTRVILLAVGQCWLGYTIMGVSTYLAFGSEVQSDALKTFPNSNVALQIARVMMGLNTGLVAYPVNLFPARQALEILLENAFRSFRGDSGAAAPESGSSPPSFLLHFGFTLVIFLPALLLALYVEDLGSVFKVIGGTAGAIIVFILPAVIRLCYEHDRSVSMIEESFGGMAVSCRLNHHHHSKVYDAFNRSAAVLMLIFGIGIFCNTVASPFVFNADGLQV